MSLKNKALLDGWILTAAKVFIKQRNIRGENLLDRFEEWMYKNCGMKKQTIYNYRNLQELMRTALKIMNCRVNMMHFVRKPEILINYFEENEEPWNHSVSCDCEV